MNKIYLLIILILASGSVMSLRGNPELPKYIEMAEGGDPRAMVTVALFYHQGDGVSVDYDKAMDWYLKAFEKHDGDSLNNMGVMFRDGLGVPKNQKIAYLLFLAVHMNGLGTEATQMRAGRNLSRLSSSMSPGAVEEALSYTWAYVEQIVKSRGQNTKVGDDVLPTADTPRIRDNDWWMESERARMTFKSPPPWDKIDSEQIDDGNSVKPSGDERTP